MSDDNNNSQDTNLNATDNSNKESIPLQGVNLSSNVQFFDSSFEMPKAREDVKFNDVGFFVYEDRRRVAVGFNITRFLEAPSIEVIITNDQGEPAGSLTVIETAATNFSLTIHLRDENPTDLYHVKAILYYATPETEREDVYTHSAMFNASKPGDQ